MSAEAGRRLHLHVPTPGELVAPSSGSAIVTVARELGLANVRGGGDSAYLIRAGLAHDTAPLRSVQVPMRDKVWLTREEKLLDLASGAVTGRAPATERLWSQLLPGVAEAGDAYTFLHSAPAAAPLLARHNYRPVVYLHNELFRGWPRWRRRALAEHVPVIAVSSFIADRFIPGAAGRGKVLALVNGVDTTYFRPATEQREPTVLFLGKIQPHKGPQLLIDAALKLFDEGMRFRVLIVGASVLSTTEQLTPFELELRRRAEPLGSWIEFRPFADRRSVADIYREATIMTVPSDWDDPCPLTLPEGMASGLACVASNRGGLPEEGKDAVLYFDPADPGGFAQQLRKLLSDDQLREEMADRARARAVEIDWSTRVATINDWLSHRGP